MAPFVARWPRMLCWGWNISSTLRRHGECLVNIRLLFWISIRYSRLKRPLYIMSATSLTFANQGNYFDLIKHFLLSNTVQQDAGGGLNSVAPEHYSDNLSFCLKEIYLIYWKANENSMAFRLCHYDVWFWIRELKPHENKIIDLGTILF